jgi:hypothetical protein
MGRSAALAIFLIFVVLFPLLAGAIFGVLIAAWTAVAHPEANEGLLTLLGALMLLPVAYITVGLQALAVGAIAAGMAIWRGRLEWWPALVAAAVLGAIQASRPAEDLATLVMMTAAQVAAAAVCLLVCRLMIGRAGAA